MNIPKQLLMNSDTQLYSFILLGFLLAFIWPVNILYTFLLTRAYIRDKTNLFKSFYEETIEQGKYTITLVNHFIQKVQQKKTNKESKQNKKEKDKKEKEEDNEHNSEADQSELNVVNSKDSSDSENVLRKRNNIDDSTSSEDIDTI